MITGTIGWTSSVSSSVPGGTVYPSWEGYDPEDDSNYHWVVSDAQFQSWLDGNFEPFLRLGGEGQRADRHHAFHGPQNRTQEDIVAARKTAQRYLYWSGGEPLFDFLDIWTEWPASRFWDRSTADFCSFWVRAFKALKAAFPDRRIGGPGIFPGSR